MSVGEINWDRLLTTESWAATLQTLVDASARALGQGNMEDIDLLQEQLRTFIKRSPPKAAMLDTIASGVLDDLMASDLASGLAAIRGRNAELQRQLLVIKGVTVDAKADAARLRLEPVIAQLTQTTQSLEKLLKEYEDAKDTKNPWYKKTRDALSGLQALLS